MRHVLTVILATAWVLEVLWLRGIRRHPHERPDAIDRDFRQMVARYEHDRRINASLGRLD